MALTGRLLLAASLWVAVSAEVAHTTLAVNQHEGECQQLCVKNAGVGFAFESKCDNSCKSYQCNKGCSSRERPLASSCKHFCINSSAPGGLAVSGGRWYCVIGCNTATSRYIQQLRDELQMEAPSLVPDTVTPNSVTIRWRGDPVPRASQHVQYRMADSSGEWSFYQPETPLTSNRATITGLLPYTKYQFRVLWLVVADQEPLTGPVSRPISTLAGGRPSSPPRQVTAAASADGRHLSVSWRPPRFPGGPLVSYLVRVSAGGGASVSVAEVAGALRSHVLGELRPDTLYTVAVAAHNREGPGPAARVDVRTPPQPAELASRRRPPLVVASSAGITRLELNIMATPQSLYRAPPGVTVTGTALDAASSLLHVATSDARVWSLPLSDAAAARGAAVAVRGVASRLTLDWLRGQLYWLLSSSGGAAGWRVQRLSVGSDDVQETGLMFSAPPQHMDVDPLNGYLYYSATSPEAAAGLYRCSLDNLTAVEQVSADTRLQFNTFALDLANFSVLVPAKRSNTVYALPMSSWAAADVRTTAVRPQYGGLSALVQYDGTLCWAAGGHLYLEALRRDSGDIYNNRFALQGDAGAVVGLHVVHPSAQPVPTPPAPPARLQAVFHSGRAVARWEAPPLPALAGPAAWQGWLYELSVTPTAAGQHAERLINTSATQAAVPELQPDTEYRLQVRAVSSAGVSGWSPVFQGRTLQRHLSSDGPLLLWSTRVGLLRSDVIGENATLLVSRHAFSGAAVHVTDVTWCDETLYLVTNDSRVYAHDLVSGRLRPLQRAVRAAAVAVDWLGRKLYWSNPVQQLIYSAPLPRSADTPDAADAAELTTSASALPLTSADTADAAELTASASALPLVTTARHLRVDALRGTLYWSTGHTVEASYLTGRNRTTVYQTGIFSGVQVVGLTLDQQGGRLFWMVRQYSGAALHVLPLLPRLDLATDTLPAATVTPLQQTQVKGPLHFFSGRLLWVMDDESAVIADPTAAHLAAVAPAGVSQLRMVAVLDAALHPLPAGHPRGVAVLPASVQPDSVALTSSDAGLRLSWRPVTNTDYARVHYLVEVNVTDGEDASPRETTAPELPIPGVTLPPYTPLRAAVRAVTRWGEAPAALATLHSAEGRPSAPRALRVFSYRSAPVTQPQNWSALVRWTAPATPAGLVRRYTVTVRRQSSRLAAAPSGAAEDPPISSPAAGDVTVAGNVTEALLTGLAGDVSYTAQVRAWTSVGAGAASNPASFRPASAPAPTALLVADEDRLLLLDLDSGRRAQLVAGETVTDVAVDQVGRRAFVLTGRHEVLGVDLRTRRKRKIASLRGNGTSIAYDWVSRSLYWAESTRRYSDIYRLNVEAAVGGGAGRAARVTGLSLPAGRRIQQLRVDPWNSRLLWTVHGSDGATIMSSPVSGGSKFGPFFASEPSDPSADRCNCSTDWMGGGVVAVRTNSSTDGRIWVEGAGGRLLATDDRACWCVPVARLPDHDGVVALSSTSLYWTGATGTAVFSGALQEEAAPAPRPPVYSGGRIHGLWPLDRRLQPLPDTHCLLPAAGAAAVTADSSASSIRLQMSAASPPLGCGRVSVAAPTYTVHYGANAAAGAGALCRRSIAYCANQTTAGPELLISALQPLTAYTVRVSAANYYSVLLQQPNIPVANITVLTVAPAPTEPRSVRARPVSPQAVEVRWLPPLSGGDRLSYRVHWRTEAVSGSLRAYGTQPTTAASAGYRLRVGDLTAQTKYQIWVSAHSSDGSATSNSSVVSAATYPYPRDIVLRAANVTSIEVAWKQPPDDTVDRSWVQYRESVSSLEWRNASLIWSQATVDGALVSGFQAIGLRARTEHQFRLRLRYRDAGDGQPFTWPTPTHAPFSFSTTGGRPAGVGAPRARLLHDSVLQLSWPPPAVTNGAGVDLYWLEARAEAAPAADGGAATRRRRRRSPGLQQPAHWTLVYNGTEPSWIAVGLRPAASYRFRVRARNEFGWSAFSGASAPVRLLSAPTAAGARGADPAVTAGAVVSALLLVVAAAAAALLGFRRCRRRPEDKKAPASPARLERLPHDLELAQLREMPAHLIRQNNALYAAGAPAGDDASGLLRVRREHITLTKFLGKGAFGEVYEGLAQHLPGGSEPPHHCRRVAIKTLAKGAREEEKLEFLKEAQLMSNFRHEHIISLLGVCVDNDPYFLLLELMEGGDLLSYLRANRGSDSDGCEMLPLAALVQMCVDVARGCQYLEQLHFVHRDLAARNCLVTSSEPQRRLVKIGDFGLARDIYKSDYYRKEGEGLLPVRWMSPEALVDGVFTSQTDVWAFGVLLWEVMTKGQQPYPARTNLQVLQYVRDGGTLGRPDNCPDLMYELMRCCWSFDPELRPTFQHCLQCLQRTQVAALQLSQSEQVAPPLTAVHNAQYSHTLTPAGAFDNNAYALDDEAPPAAEDLSISWRRSSSATSGGQESWRQLLPPGDADCDSVFGDGGAAAAAAGDATLPSRARLRLAGGGSQRHGYLQLRADSDPGGGGGAAAAAGYEVPVSYAEIAAATAAAAGEASAGGAPHQYQNCVAAAAPAERVDATTTAAAAAGRVDATTTAAAAAAGSVDDIQFSFVDTPGADDANPRLSVASILSQISGVHIDVDPGATAWC